MRFWLVLILAASLLPFGRAQAQTPPGAAISNLTVNFRFGDQASFEALLAPADNAGEVFLFVQAEGESTRTLKASIDSNGKLTASVDFKTSPMRPFARVDYWFRVSMNGSTPVTSDHQKFIYEDNRFTWNKLEDGSLQVYWIQGDVAFGQAILNSAKNGLKSSSAFLPLTLKDPLRIFVYNRTVDLQSALQLGHQSWVAGHASPDLGVVLASIPLGPEQQIELDRQIPHEIMHILTYQATGDAYNRMPVWFLEGLASQAELYPNPDYRMALDQGIKAKSILGISTLCASFPQEASGAFLAYAESASFVRFLTQKFGQPGLQRLMAAYQNSLGCSEGVSTALGSSLEQFEIRWRQETLGLDTTTTILNNLAPYLIAGILLILLTIGYGFLSAGARQKKSQAEPK